MDKLDLKYNDTYMLNIYKELGYDESVYPLTPLGLIMFLANIGIDVYIWKPRYSNDYIWCGVEKGLDGTRDIFSQDLSEYKEFDDAVNVAIIESACYASLNLKKK
jgi:hypothetical protein